jgi:DJ-1 family protein
MKSALVLLAPGCEEMEAVIVLDVLRRAGVRVVGAGLEAGVLVASRGVRLEPDLPLDAVGDAKDFDALILPGGMGGTRALREDARVRDLVLHYAQAPGKILACICAAALVLDAAQVLEGRTYTCYPGVEKEIRHGERADRAVVVDGRLVTSQGPGTAFAFALKLVAMLRGESVAREVSAGLLLASD